MLVERLPAGVALPRWALKLKGEPGCAGQRPKGAPSGKNEWAEYCEMIRAGGKHVEYWRNKGKLQDILTNVDTRASCSQEGVGESEVDSYAG